MDALGNMSVTEILGVVTVYSPKGEDTKVSDRESYGLSFCYNGQITYTLDGIDYVSDPGSAVLLPKGRTYILHHDKTGNFPLINFDCVEFLSDKHIVLPLKNPAALLSQFEYMKKLALFEGNRVKLMSEFYSLIDGINAQTNENNTIIGASVAYLEANLSDPLLTNEALAARSNISEVYFRQLFLKQYGITPRQYIINARIAKAKQMLSSGNKKISAVAEECGFTSVYHFCRCFKERTGMTPTEYMISNKTLGL